MTWSQYWIDCLGDKHHAGVNVGIGWLVADGPNHKKERFARYTQIDKGDGIAFFVGSANDPVNFVMGIMALDRLLIYGASLEDTMHCSIVHSVDGEFTYIGMCGNNVRGVETMAKLLAGLKSIHEAYCPNLEHVSKAIRVLKELHRERLG